MTLFSCEERSLMYREVTKSWNPFVGCNHYCSYCDPSFQRQAKRQKQRCELCYKFEPHFHPERLDNYLPKKGLVFACSMGDISFATNQQIRLIFEEMAKRTETTFLIQSKNPSCFIGLEISDNVIVGTTMETNRHTNGISSAPNPVLRYDALERVNCKHKSVTIEPIMDFDHSDFVDLIRELSPDMAWIGYNNYPESVKLPEPSLKKTNLLIKELKKITDVRLKTIREKID